jgi:hypothetical protein
MNLKYITLVSLNWYKGFETLYFNNHCISYGMPYNKPSSTMLLHTVTIKEIDTFNVVLKHHYWRFSQNTYMVLLYMFLRLNDEVTNVLCVSLLSHDRYQYDSLILSKQTWAYPHHHLQQLLCCQGRWRGADVMKECLKTKFHLSSTLVSKLCVHCANGFDNVESVYFLYSNPEFTLF